MTRFPGLDQTKIAGMIAKPVSFRPATRIPLETVQAVKASKADERAESELQEDVIAYLRSAKGVRQIDVDHSRKGLTAGVPDLRFAYYGRAVFIELKNSKGRTTDAQEQDHERRRMDGAVGGVFRSIPEIKEFLDKIENKEDGR